MPAFGFDPSLTALVKFAVAGPYSLDNRKGFAGDTRALTRNCTLDAQHSVHQRLASPAGTKGDGFD